MTRKTVRNLLLALAAVVSIGATAEAAPKKPVHHRPKHSSRVASGTTHKRRPTLKKAPPSKSQAHRAPAKRKPTTKPK